MYFNRMCVNVVLIYVRALATLGGASERNKSTGDEARAGITATVCVAGAGWLCTRGAREGEAAGAGNMTAGDNGCVLAYASGKSSGSGWSGPVGAGEGAGADICVIKRSSVYQKGCDALSAF